MNEDALDIQVRDHGQACIVALKGELVGDSCDRLRSVAMQRMNEQRMRDFVLDLRHTEFVDSQGFETLLWLLETCEEKLGQLRIANCPTRVWNCMEITRLSMRFDLRESVDEAVASLN